eukprot:3531-Rhodomonas_salina.1
MAGAAAVLKSRMGEAGKRSEQPRCGCARTLKFTGSMIPTGYLASYPSSIDAIPPRILISYLTITLCIGYC